MCIANLKESLRHSHPAIKEFNINPAQLPTPPEDFICPLTKELMVDPVMTKYGHSFERKAILEWLMEEDNLFCPISGKPLRPSSIVANKGLEWKIRRWLHDQVAPEEETSISDEDKEESVVMHLQEHEGLVFIGAVTPKHFICPITKEIMHDPVMTSHGQVYERQAILDYLSDGEKYTCPETGEALFPHDLVSNYKLKREIEQWKLTKGENDLDDDNEDKVEDGSLATKQKLPLAACIGVRGDTAIEIMRQEHEKRLREEGKFIDADDLDPCEPFSASCVIDPSDHTSLASLGHVY